MNNPNPQSTTNRHRQIASRMGLGITLGAALGAALGNVALGIAVGVLIGGVGAVFRTKRS